MTFGCVRDWFICLARISKFLADQHSDWLGRARRKSVLSNESDDRPRSKRTNASTEVLRVRIPDRNDDGPRRHDIFCIAASMGGIEAISELLRQIPAEFPGAIFVTQHTSSTSRRIYLAEIFGRHANLPCHLASDGEPFRKGSVYVAVPDHHLLIERDCIRTAIGPKENYARPAADPMFRSAAVHHGGAAVGVVLTGMLDDGSAGLEAIKQCGGKALAQHPETAIAPDMPSNAIRYCDVDGVLPLDGIAAAMSLLAESSAGDSVPPSQTLLTELAFAQSVESNIPAEQRIGQLSPYMCPDCSGQMWQVDQTSLRRFRCHVGHAHTIKSLVEYHSDAAERMGWSMLRTLREKERMIRQLADEEDQKGNTDVAAIYRQQAEAVGQQAALISNAIKLAPESNVPQGSTRSSGIENGLAALQSNLASE
ncbi:chemotaxis protein CheB [Roseiconus lacunae]|uniref:chemotaxis protein CheB n=1 Tax=Roseiconus lacunae TaxID=2605694 RepID=UPI003315EBE3